MTTHFKDQVIVRIDYDDALDAYRWISDRYGRGGTTWGICTHDSGDFLEFWFGSLIDRKNIMEFKLRFSR